MERPQSNKGKKVANKVVRYFPLTPRLQRMFNTKHIAKWMTWHATGQSKENALIDYEPKNYGKEIGRKDAATNTLFQIFPDNDGNEFFSRGSMLRLETGNASLRKTFRENNKQPLQLGFDYADLGTFHPLGNFAVASYFNLAEWYNNQDKVVVGSNVYTVGERVRLGLELKLRLLWRKNKNRIKADHYTKHDSPDEAKNHPPPPRVWGDRTQDEWNELVDWWSHPNRVSRSLQNAANRAKNTILTHQGKKSFAQGRNEYKVEKGHYEDLIETWRKGHSSKKTGEFKTEQNKQRYLDMKAMQGRIKAGIIPFKTDQEILDEVVPITELPRFITNPHNNDTRSVDELARDKAGEDNDLREDNQQSGGDYSEDEEGDNEEVQDESEESEESD
ncbi:acidic leucine-rich nuclear phosphoprotein 32 family member A [Tanacetum coccineum]